MKPKSEAELRNEQLIAALDKSNEENVALKQRIQELELRVSSLEQALQAAGAALPPPQSARRVALENAIVKDSVVNN